MRPYQPISSFVLSISLIILVLSCDQNPNKTHINTESSTNVPVGMKLIPAGQFLMGAKSEQAYKDEYPRHDVKVSSFYMDEHEVTNAEFIKFVNETGYKTIAERDIDWDEMKTQLPEGTPKPADSVLQAGSLVFKSTTGPVDLNNYAQWWQWTIGADWKHPEGPDTDITDRMSHPVVHIAWEDANAYAKWSGKRLPTEAEWEWAAMGGNENSKYPWGNTLVEEASDKANFWQGKFPYQNYVMDGFAGTAPIKSYPKNGYGLYDMAGNVWEWCQDKYDVNAYADYKNSGLASNPLGSNDYYDPREPFSPKHVIRGGSFLCNDDYCSGYRVARRMSSSKDSGFNHTGFRCVKDVK